MPLHVTLEIQRQHTRHFLRRSFVCVNGEREEERREGRKEGEKEGGKEERMKGGRDIRKEGGRKEGRTEEGCRKRRKESRGRKDCSSNHVGTTRFQERIHLLNWVDSAFASIFSLLVVKCGIGHVTAICLSALSIPPLFPDQDTRSPKKHQT